MKPLRCQVLVTGAGPAGAVAAIELVRRGHDVLMVESRSGRHARIGEILPTEGAEFLRLAGLWWELETGPLSVSPGTRTAWGAADPAGATANLDAFGTGWHLDRTAFDAKLRALAEREGAELRYQTRIRGVTSTRRGWLVDLVKMGSKDGAEAETVHASIIVDATGKHAWLCSKLGGTRRVFDKLLAISRTYAPQNGGLSERNTLVEAGEEGWHYSVPLPDRHVRVVYMTDADLYRRNRNVDRPGPLTRARLAGYTALGRASCRTAYSALTEVQSPWRWLPVGDAAASFDPLSARGLAFTIRSGMEGARAASRWLAGDESAPDDYLDLVRAIYGEYLRDWQRCYQAEQRWRDSPFWARRHVAKASLPLVH